MSKSAKIAKTLTQGYNDIDLEDMEQPKYLEHLELSDEEIQPKKKTISNLVEDIWVPQPELIEKSLENLEEQDKLFRSQISKVSEKEKIRTSQLILQRQIYKDLIELGMKIHSLCSFLTIDEFRKNVKSLLKKMVSLQARMNRNAAKNIKNIEENNKKIWDWMAGLAREWSSRVDLKIGADIIDQVMRESEKKNEYDIQVFLLRELKTENTIATRNSNTKPKHKFSKHRKLKFDVHEKLQNFMTPEYASWDSRLENLMKTLFGKQVESGEKIYLDVPLI